MRSSIAVVTAMVLLMPAPIFAQDAAKSPAEAAPPDPPGLGEIMTLQQLRHIKLWFAGHSGNWPLADYELDELGEGFDDIGKIVGSDLVDKQVGAPIKALEKAVEDKNRAAFDAAFDQLSAGCNSCHRSLDRKFIVIQRPTSLPYSNQNFTPQK